jgi:diaminopimelate decarboxylase
MTPDSRPFHRVDGVLHCGSHPLSHLADRFGTPLYVYDAHYVEERFRAFRAAFAGVDPLVAFAVKANGNLAILHRLGRLGAGADIVSGGELHRALKAGIDPGRVVFSGVGKSEAELRAGLSAGILAFNVESRSEAVRLQRIASEEGRTAPLAVRVNPDVAPRTPHQHISTGHGSSKFGVAPEEALEIMAWASAQPGLQTRGLAVHIGSQIPETEPFLRALDRVLGLVGPVRRAGGRVDFVDIGGGYGIRDRSSPELNVRELAGQVVPLVRDAGLRLVVEPGRSIVGEAGVMLTRVEYVKRGGKKTFVVVDGGMSDFIRPSHYGGFHEIEPVEPTPGEPTHVDVVGPICESGDFLAQDRELELPAEGDLLAVFNAGAYGFTMASNYNARPRPAEALIVGDDVHLVRERETLDDLLRGEHIPEAP